jgi:hypothetical protein
MFGGKNQLSKDWTGSSKILSKDWKKAKIWSQD